MSLLKTLAVLGLSVPLAMCFGQSPLKSMSFSSEDAKVVDFVQLPERVFALLVNDKQDFPGGPPLHLHCEDHEQPGPEPHPELLCSKVTLSSATGADYLVIGVGDLRGAHIVPFWLFHQDDSGASLLLKIRSDQIEIGPKRFSGHFEIRSTWIQGAGAAITTSTFRFNGKKYVRFRTVTEHQ